MESLVCPVCSEEIPLDPTLKKNDSFNCPFCDETLWVTSELPLRVQRVMSKWDDNEDDEWDWQPRRIGKASHSSRTSSRDEKDDLEYATPQHRQGKNGRKKQ